MTIVTRWLLAGCLALAAWLPAAAGERVLHDRPAMFGRVIVSEDEAGVRILRFEPGGARQSLGRPGDPDFLGLPYVKVAITGLALTTEPLRMLVVGLGGGTLPMYLRKYFPAAQIDAVEIDPAVVDAARRFFGFVEDARLRAHVADGRRFIEQASGRYDVIFLDAFGTDSVPQHLVTEEFLRSVRRILSTGGVLVSNVWDSSLNPLFDAMVRTYQEVFDDLYVLDVAGTGNVLLFALPRLQPMTVQEFRARCNAVAAARRMSPALCDAAQFRFTHAAVRSGGTRVLRDRDIRKTK